LKYRKKLSWRSCALGRNEIAAGHTSTRTDWKRLIPGFAVSLICLVVIFYLIDLDKFIQAIRQARLSLVLLSGVMSILWLMMRSGVWYTLLQRKAAYRDVFFTTSEGYVLNNVLPFRLGELGRAYLLGRKSGLGFWQVIPTIMVERALDLMIASSLFLSTLPFVVGVSWARQAAMIMAVVVVTGLVAMYLLARNQAFVLSTLDRLGQRWRWARILNGGQVRSFLTGLSVLTDTRLFLTAVGLMLFNWAFNVFQYYLMLLAFFPDASPLWAFFALGSAALGIAAPSSPGSLGVFEAVLVGALAVFGVEPSGAAAFAITMHVTMYISTAIFGVYALVVDGLSLTGLYRELGQIKNQNTM
jgi:hypothetical protein